MSEIETVRDLLDVISFSPRDQSDLMERPFFSLSKRKRIAPIDYTSPDGKATVKVTANPNFGMATIWDSDILTFCVSQIVARRNTRSNDSSPIVHTTPSALLTSIGRQTGGAQYRELMAGIQRLRTTQVETNIRSERGRKWGAFHFLGDAEGSGADQDGLTSLSLRVPDWLMDGIETGHFLSIDRAYFDITGGIERAIYRAARKHAGSNSEGWTCRLSVLHAKTGSESKLKGFAHTIREIAFRNDLPTYAMQITTTKSGEAAVHFIDRAFLSKAEADAIVARRMRTYRDSARTAWIDEGRPAAGFTVAWESWLAKGLPPQDFAAGMKTAQGRLI